jgi:hypothetical protein
MMMACSQAGRRYPPGLAGWNRLPAGIALCHIRIIPGRVGAVIPSPGRIGLGVAIIAVVRIVIPAIGISIETEP